MDVDVGQIIQLKGGLIDAGNIIYLLDRVIGVDKMVSLKAVLATAVGKL